MGDVFDERSSERYAKYRPPPPKDYLDKILAYIYEKIPAPLQRVVDVGCGTGQCTLFLSPHFQHVLGTDISSSQVEQAKKAAQKLPNLEFKVSQGEVISVESSSIQLLTAAACIHYFDLDKFYSEAKRVLVPNGVLAVSTIMIPVLRTGDSSVDEKINGYLAEYNKFILREYKDPGLELTYNRYKDVSLPFRDIQRVDGIWSVSKCTVAEFGQYLRSWCSYQAIVKKLGKEVTDQAVQDLIKKLMETVKSGKSEDDTGIELHFEYIIIMGRNRDQD